MRIVFCFIPCSYDMFNEFTRTLGVIISGATNSNYKWFVSRIQNNDFFCIHQSMSNNQKLRVTQNLIQSIISNSKQKLKQKLKHQQQNITESISVWVFRHHTFGDERATDQPGVYIDSLQENNVIPFVNQQNKTLDWFLNELRRGSQPHLHLTINDPLIIVFTPSGRANGEWEKSIEVARKNKGSFYDDDLNPTDDENKIRVVEFKINNNYTILFVKEDGDRTHPLHDLLNKILNDTKWKDIAEKYVAVHDLRKYINDVSQFKNKVKQICDFHHYDYGTHKEFCDLLIKFLDEVEKGSSNIEDTCKKIIEKIKELAKEIIIKNFSLLKHRIMNSFLDLDIDYQGIKEVNEKDKNKTKEYLDKVLASKKSKRKKSKQNYYKQKLVNLWFYLTGKNDLKINETKITLGKDQLPNQKSILDLINELDNEKKDAIEKQWRSLLNHVGLKVNNDPFNVSKISVDENSEIVKYLENLDEMIQDQSKRDINKFLGKIEKMEDGQKKITYFDFHQWYLKLGDLLESLKIFLE